MTQTNEFTVEIQHGKSVSKLNVPSDSTLGKLREMIQELLQIEPKDQKLFVRGKVLQANLEDKVLQEVLPSSTSPIKILVLKVSKEEADQFVNQEAKIQAKLEARTKFAQSGSTTRSRIVTLDSATDKFTFHGIDILPEFPHQQDKARALLQRIKDDEGVKHIMQKYEWMVGRLIELSPAEESILGYNRNKGEVIALRLRTNDLQGFRPYDMILKVALHELTHNVHSEHDVKFHTLCSQLGKEYRAFWAQRLGGERLLDPTVSRMAHYDEQEEEHTDSHGYEGGTFVLGGSSDDNPTSRQELREKMAKAHDHLNKH